MTISPAVYAPPTPGPVPASALRRRDYHRLARAQANYRWWRPLVTLLTAATAYLALMLIILTGLTAAVLINPELEASLGLVDEQTDLYNPYQFMALMITLILLIPAVMIGVAGGRRPVGTLLSVAGRLRGGLLARSLAICLSVYLTVQLAFLTVSWVGGEPLVPSWHPYSGWLIAGALLIVPLQAAAEEFAFRALPMQVLGAWLRNPWWGILLPLPLFVVGHSYNPAGMIGVAGFALAAGVLVWRTGGLEAAIALHAVNNSLGFLFSALGWGDLNATDVTTLDTVVSLATVAACTALILWADQKNQSRQRIHISSHLGTPDRAQVGLAAK